MLEGAPAIVTAVDRYVTADASRTSDFLTPEVRAAVKDGKPPWFDAGELRARDQKLGLGSSAAILVASLGALMAKDRGITKTEDLRRAVFEPALVAHRSAQGGGSGVDVATSVHGGTIIAVKKGTGLSMRNTAIPEGLHINVLFAGMPASTSELVGRVRAFKARSPHEYDGVIENLRAAAEDAERSFDEGAAADVVRALRDQLRGLVDLGEHAGTRIVTREVSRLADLAAEENAVVVPAGAGGGDIAIYAGTEPPSPNLAAAFIAERQERLAVGLGAPGLHLVDDAKA